jgi:hypothetical protein
MTSATSLRKDNSFPACRGAGCLQLEMSCLAEQEAISEKGEDGEKKCGTKKMCRPKKWRSVVDGIKQPCWCGEEWKDYQRLIKHPQLGSLSEAQQLKDPLSTQWE